MLHLLLGSPLLLQSLQRDVHVALSMGVIVEPWERQVTPGSTRTLARAEHPSGDHVDADYVQHEE